MFARKYFSLGLFDNYLEKSFLTTEYLSFKTTTSD